MTSQQVRRYLSSISMLGGGWAWQQRLSWLGQFPVSLQAGQTSSWSQVLSFLSSTELTMSEVTNCPTDIARLTEEDTYDSVAMCDMPEGRQCLSMLVSDIGATAMVS